LVRHITKNLQTVPLRLGLQFLVVSIPMIEGNPVAGVILKAQNGRFWVFTGVLMFASAVLYGAGVHITNVIVISPLILIIIKSPHLILIDYINYIDYTLIS
jgi:hypothetical protein